MIKQTLERKLTREIFINDEGAVDLASIMVGIIVIGIIGGVIAATIFAVVPWAQDNAAKASLSAVQQAENVYSGLDASGNTAAGKAVSSFAFITPVSLLESNISEAPTTITAAAAPATANYASLSDLRAKKLISESNKIGVTLGANSKCYVAAVVSDSGKTFYTESDKQGIFTYTNQSAVCDGTTIAAAVAAIQNSSQQAGGQLPGASNKGSFEQFGYRYNDLPADTVVYNGTATAYNNFTAWLYASPEYTPGQFTNIPFINQYEGQKSTSVTKNVTNVYFKTTDGTKTALTGNGTVSFGLDSNGKVQGFQVKSTSQYGFKRTDDASTGNTDYSDGDKYISPGTTELHFSVDGVDQFMVITPMYY